MGIGYHFIDLFFDVARDAFSFISYDEGDFPFCIPLVAKGVPFISVPKVQKPSSLSLSRVLTEVGHSRNRYMLNSTCGRFGNDRSHSDSTVLGNDDT